VILKRIYIKVDNKKLFGIVFNDVSLRQASNYLIGFD